MPRRFTSSLAVIGSLSVALFLVGGARASADTLFESATLGPPDSIGGVQISHQQFLGVRFSTTQDEIITGLGIDAEQGLKLGNGMIFLAVLPLSPKALPTSFTLDNAIFHGLITPPLPSAEVTLTTDFFLPAGRYGLITGSGLFGATGIAATSGDDHNIGTPSYFFSDLMGNRWVNEAADGGDPVRFVVDGHAVAPEPCSLALLAGGVLPLLGCLRRRK